MARRTSNTIPAHIAARLTSCRRHLAEAKVSAYIASNPVDQFYLSGFTGEDGVAVITRDDVYLITDGRFAEQVEREAPWAKAVVRKGAISAEISKLRSRHRWQRVGFQAEHLSYASAGVMRKAIRPAVLVRTKPFLPSLRRIKDAVELAVIREAIRVAEEGFRATCRAIRVGMTERQIAARLQYEMQRRGASGASFPIIVAEGPNASLPHYRAGDRAVREGSLILIDWGATVSHYHSDLTRVVFIRRIPPRFARMYDAVLEAQRRAIQAVRPEATTSDVDHAARQHLTRAGFGKAFVHATGHGLGLDIHEAPSLSRRMPQPLQPGMVVTVEPGVYFPGVGGVRIEDDVLVTPGGVEVLSSLSTNLKDMVIRG